MLDAVMNTTPPPSVFDVNGLAAIKNQVKSNDPQALKAAARQFEALFLQIVLKTMREATPKEGIFDSDQTRMYESLLDQQLAQVMSNKGGTGLAAMIERQLSRANQESADLGALPLMQPGVPHLLRSPALPLPSLDTAPPPMRPLDTVPFAPANPLSPSSSSAPSSSAPSGSSPRDFVSRLWPHAEEASRTTGVPAQFMIAQAALETGWGQSEPRHADGRPSFNLFGIKAGRGWTGPTVETATTEYVDGVAQRQTERFRAYGSYEEAFRDYANLLTSRPRYAAVLGAQDASTFARGLFQAGYATDPAYAAKLERIITGPTLRQALLG